MRTVRSSGRPGGGAVCLAEGVSACQGGVYLPHAPPWTEWQTRVKTLPCRNYVADGKNWNLKIKFWSWNLILFVLTAYRYQPRLTCKFVKTNLKQCKPVGN